jgi:hypothetical protein
MVVKLKPDKHQDGFWWTAYGAVARNVRCTGKSIRLRECRPAGKLTLPQCWKAVRKKPTPRNKRSRGCRRHGDSLFAVLQMSATVWRREEKPGGVWNAARPALE